MLVTATDAAREVIDRCRGERSGVLTITIGTGCCESTAPFLYEDFWPGPDQAVVGDVDGVEVFAPEYLRTMYADDDGMVIDVIHENAESLSIETEHGVRLILRGQGVDLGRDDACVVDDASPAPSRVVTTGAVPALPPHLQGARIR
jgi:uncharacterized protein (DUF779 family)